MDIDAYLEAIEDAEPYPYWFDDADEPDSNRTLVRVEHCDLCVVGGGYTGLWTAVLAKERDPSRDVVLLEGDTIGWGASGRNGGFVEASLTHGVANGQLHFAEELPRLEQLGLLNLDAIEEAIGRYGIDCDWERTGVIDVATNEHYLYELTDDEKQLRDLGQDVQLLDAEAMRAEVHSPTYVGGLWRRGRAAIVDPARLAWGLKAAAEQLGVRIYEHTKATELERDGVGVLVHTPLGSVRAARVALATNAFPPLLRATKHYVVPVWDYVLCTEPLNAEQKAAIGWERRQGLSDTNNQFHYYRLTEDDRIIWGGYDAVYYFRGKTDPAREHNFETWAKLAQHFFQTFPQLDGLKFSHIWGGTIDTCTRFSVFWQPALRGKVVYAGGYTGLGVGASRFGAEVMLDLLEGRRTTRSELQFVRKKPVPWPPEPFRWTGIQLTRWALDQEDKTGKRNVWLRGLDRMGLGFDT